MNSKEGWRFDLTQKFVADMVQLFSVVTFSDLWWQVLWLSCMHNFWDRPFCCSVNLFVYGKAWLQPLPVCSMLVIFGCIQFFTNIGVPGRQPADGHLLVQLHSSRFRQGSNWSRDVCFEVKCTDYMAIPADTESGFLPRFCNVQVARYRKMIWTDIMTNGTWAENMFIFSVQNPAQNMCTPVGWFFDSLHDIKRWQNF